MRVVTLSAPGTFATIDLCVSCNAKHDAGQIPQIRDDRGNPFVNVHRGLHRSNRGCDVCSVVYVAYACEDTDEGMTFPELYRGPNLDEACRVAKARCGLPDSAHGAKNGHKSLGYHGPKGEAVVNW